MSKFGKAHRKAKITAGCFDGTKRRIITTAMDGSCRIHNFSNGHKLSELFGAEKITSFVEKKEMDVKGSFKKKAINSGPQTEE